MGKKPDLKSIENLLLSGEAFQMTEAEYKKSTKTTMPKENYYLKHSSAVAKLAQKHGYSLRVQERIITFVKN